ncbi:MAG: Mth938-like domain-containing protein [Pseudomonadota bacterium]
MKMTELDFEGQPPIDGYAPDGFRVRGRFLEGPALIGPDGAAAWSAPSLEAADPAPLLALAGRIDVLLLGAGAEIRHAPRPLSAPLEEAGLGVEIMATPSACRTYNVMLSEGRRVAAALLPVGAPG